MTAGRGNRLILFTCLLSAWPTYKGLFMSGVLFRAVSNLCVEVSCEGQPLALKIRLF